MEYHGATDEVYLSIGSDVTKLILAHLRTEDYFALYKCTYYYYYYNDQTTGIKI